MTTLPDLQIEIVPIEQLKANPRHTRIVSKAQRRRLSASIDAFRMTVPLLVDDDMMVLCGHVRLEACRAKGYTQLPVIRLRHLSPAQAEAFAIAENRLTETGEFDDAMLGEVFRDLAGLDLDFGLDVTGFDLAEIDLKIAGLDEADTADGDDEPMEAGPAVTRPGDLWRLGDHRLLCASALERGSFQRLMGDDRAAIVVADMPYNCAITGHVSTTGKFREFAMATGEMSRDDFQAFMTQACALMAEFSQDGALAYNFMDWRNLQGLLQACDAAFDALINICVWVKPNGGMGSFYRSAHEMVVVSKKGAAPHQNHVQLGRFGRDRRNTWMAPGANMFLKSAEEAEFMGEHPTPKPVQMLADILMDASTRSDIVLDPFGGSGSTLIAAQRLGRRARLLELDPLYCDLIIRRWQRHTGDVAVREDGVPFEPMLGEVA